MQVTVLGGVTGLQEFLFREQLVSAVDDDGDIGLPPNAVRFEFAGEDAELSDLLNRLIGAGIRVCLLQ